MISTAGDSRMSRTPGLYDAPTTSTRASATPTLPRLEQLERARRPPPCGRVAIAFIARSSDRRVAARSRRPSQQVVRVARDAVPADAGARIEGHEAVRLRRRRPGDLDRVEPEARLAPAISFANAMLTARKVFS